MTPEEFNLYVPAIAGIAGALVGAISAFIPNLITENFRNKKEAELVESSLIAEITALVEIADERKYMAWFDQCIAHLETQHDGATMQLQVDVQPHYSRIYQASAHRIGIIDKTLASDIVRFHMLIDAVVQDVSPSGVLHKGGTLQSFKENQQILAKAFSLARKYTDRT